MKKVFSVNSELNQVTGIQKVLLDIHKALKGTFDTKIVGQFNYKEINAALKIKREDYVQLKNPFMFRNSIVILHQRKYLILFEILNNLFFQNITIVYIHHSLLKGHRLLTCFPKHIITISTRCVENLTQYFQVPLSQITKIYNCVEDTFTTFHQGKEEGKITILYAAKVYPLKRQIEIFNQLKNDLSPNIQILFAGDGPDYQVLREKTQGDDRFVCLGFKDNIHELLDIVDYSMLYSEYEGLPISLIEATMMGNPIICNDVGGNLEIAREDYNAFICNSWEELIKTLNSLPKNNSKQYKQMSQNSRNMYLDNFTFDKFKRDYQDYFSKL